MKAKTPHAIILFLHNGFKPRDIINRFGYPEATVYKYSSKNYPQALKEFHQKIKENEMR